MNEVNTRLNPFGSEALMKAVKNAAPKILIGVIATHHASRMEWTVAQRERLKAGSLPYKFVFGTCESQGLPSREPFEDELFAQVDDGRNWMVLKDKALFQYALEQGYEYVFRMCDDTVLYQDRLIKHYPLLSQHDYAGTMCGYGSMPNQGTFVLRYLDYMHGGVGIWLSRRAMEMLVRDSWKGPKSSPYTDKIDITPSSDFNGCWSTYWDDLWIGEVLKGNMPYHDLLRNNVYLNYKVHVYDDPELFASNLPFDENKIISRHALCQMGTTTLKPKAFSTRTGTMTILKVDWATACGDFKQVQP
jgi:hypothetical protein